MPYLFHHFLTLFAPFGSFPDAAVHSDIHLTGEIGGNLTFRCPADNFKSIEFFYFQRNDDFINGFHTKKIPTPAWSNTKVDDKDRTTVHMFNLNASHDGDYECHIKYSNSLNKTVIKVSLTGKNFLNLTFNTVFH